MCDNTDCTSDAPYVVPHFDVKLTEEFDNSACNWCIHCIKRDIHMIAEIKIVDTWFIDEIYLESMGY